MMRSRTLIVYVLTWAISCSSQHFNQTVDLLQTVLKNYDKRVRPVLNQSDAIVVNVTFGLLSIEYFDEVNSKFSVNGYLSLSWNDEIINWDAAVNHGIRLIQVPAKDVWYPELVLAYVHGQSDKPVDDWWKVHIDHTGRAAMAPRDLYKSTCKADVTYYPFDIQTCSLLFKSWVYRKYEVQLQSPVPYIKSEYFIDHGEWELIDNSSIAGSLSDARVTITFKLQRKPLFFVVNIILPIILMSILNVLVFALPSQSGEKVSYSITVLLAIAVFLTMVSDSLPRTSTPMSLMSYFLMVNLLNSALICVMTIFNMYVYFKENTEPFPAWVSFILMIACLRHRRYFQDASKTKDNTETRTQTLDVDKEAVKDVSNDDSTQFLTWKDVSELIDKLCIVGFLFATVVNSGTFMFLVTKQYKSSH